ncbi:flagellar hook-basal body complex protein FliE [Clostridium formicaceticum]|uniref:Flagellar hook-basal body complex protein FliE n=1 Tax=Clostridium formicaceticum TaxID=1497 RepID=A0AAC9WGE1_9CLOT|nr:flagellar hook-basal body complex protein FliE [Clostridium formicaceticum]AOY77323.1 flagellar hook-basal body complex protein FliE [Clostridium formicaceticum]ARE87867.1 Flagellar hook-basal body complex protein FliE [Clostridium formicaceticum]
MQVNRLNVENNKILGTNLGLFNDKNSKTVHTSFKELLTGAINEVNKLESNAQAYSMKLASGEIENIHEAMVASQKAEVSLQFMMEIRNKVLDAYREIMRMQI